MTAVFSHNFRTFNAKRFIDSITNTGEDYPYVYLTIGRPIEWAADSYPPTANTSIDALYEVWRNMIGAKKITGNDLHIVIPRHDWTSNTAYIAYDNMMESANLQGATFYVMTDEWNVYKCLANNGGAVSTVKPTSTLTTGAVETADNYIWKYMYSVTTEERIRFMTDEYMPVRTLTEDNGSLQWQVQEDAVDGGIHTILVTDAGSGYSNANTITVSVSGDGSGAVALARVNTTTNTISSIAITNPGTGYSYGSVTITDSGSGTGANARPIISPSGGHGADPMYELGGSYVLINPRIRGTEDNKLPVENEYRQIAIIKDPIRKGTSNVASNTVYSQVTTLTMDTGVSAYEEDETVYQGSSVASSTFRGTVLTWDDANNVLRLVDVRGTAQADILNGETSRAARLVQSVTDSELKPFSGKLLYIDNIPPIQRAVDQTEDFKIIIKF